MALRLFAGGVATETNVFSPLPTGPRDYAVARPGDPRELRDDILAGTTFARYAAVAEAHACEYVQGTYAFALPAGVTSRHAYEELRDVLLQEIGDASPLDGLLLTLHGAMVAEGYVDCEQDLVARARAVVGSETVIGVLLDLHCDVAQAMVDAADVVVTYKEYPHTDINDRADELAVLVIATAEGNVKPVSALFDCRMIGLYPTWREPMRTFVDHLRAVEQQRGILSVSLAHGFPWGDSPEMGARVLVVADGDIVRARGLAEELGRAFFDIRHEVSLAPLPLKPALDRALSHHSANRPVVVADVSDNTGGGAGGDSTFALRELLARTARGVAVAILWDPVVVHQAFAAGIGAELAVRLGGKLGPGSGDPLDVTATVGGLVPDLVQRWPQTTGNIAIRSGDCAWLAIDGIDVVVGDVRQQVLGLEVFTAFGIDPSERRLLLVKSANHFAAAYEPIAEEIIYMSTPGTLTYEFGSLPYIHTNRNQFPCAHNPWRS
jgi:microcystin degradation protein MlrC